MVKRLFDIVFSLVGLILGAPVIGFIALAIKIDSSGPVFYRGIRTGQFGKTFRIFKFRTMVKNAEKLGGPSTALKDSRLTKVGKFLRKYKLDELPQLINILKGEMSAVGPRPQVEEYTKRYTKEEKIILNVKPGLTDYASIEFINLDKILGNDNVDKKYFEEIEPRKNLLRIKYAQKHSFLLDLKIIFLTVLKILQIRRLWNTKN